MCIIGTSLADAEKNLIERTLRAYPERRQDVADVLGISLRTLQRRIASYGFQDLRGFPMIRKIKARNTPPKRVKTRT